PVHFLRKPGAIIKSRRQGEHWSFQQEALPSRRPVLGDHQVRIEDVTELVIEWINQNGIRQQRELLIVTARPVTVVVPMLTHQQTVAVRQDARQQSDRVSLIVPLRRLEIDRQIGLFVERKINILHAVERSRIEGLEELALSARQQQLPI